MMKMKIDKNIITYEKFLNKIKNNYDEDMLSKIKEALKLLLR